MSPRAATPDKAKRQAPAAPQPPKARRAVGSKPRSAKKRVVSPEDRARFIAEAAYFRAERRGFAPGDEMSDWLEAEVEIDALLAS